MKWFCLKTPSLTLTLSQFPHLSHSSPLISPLYPHPFFFFSCLQLEVLLKKFGRRIVSKDSFDENKKDFSLLASCNFFRYSSSDAFLLFFFEILSGDNLRATHLQTLISSLCLIIFSLELIFFFWRKSFRKEENQKSSFKMHFAQTKCVIGHIFKLMTF